MPRAQPDWTLYRSFAAVLREGSLSAAARSIGLSQPTLSRHIAALEQALGLVLFTRSPDGLEPTAEASALRAEAEALAMAAEALFRAASGPMAGNAGTVRITASEVIAAEVIGPILAQLQDEHPRITIELLVSNRLDDILRRDADIAVRMTRPTQMGLVAKLAGRSTLGLYAHPSYLSRKPPPVTPAGLADHALIGFDTPATYTKTFALDGEAVTRDRFSLRSDSDMAQLAAIRAGCGIGVCHGRIAERSGLVHVLPAAFAPRVELWLAMHQDLRASARYRTVFDRLYAGFHAYLKGSAAPRPGN